MARNSKVVKKSPSRTARSAEARGRVRRGRPKVCIFCAERTQWVDYKDLNVLRRFMNDRGRIKSRGATGTCAQHQRDVAVAIKTARELAMLPYAVRTMSSESREGRGGRRGGPPPTAPVAEAGEGSVDGEADPDATDGDPTDVAEAETLAV
jgi:small subunit ribosomal protein S18